MTDPAQPALATIVGDALLPVLAGWFGPPSDGMSAATRRAIVSETAERLADPAAARAIVAALDPRLAELDAELASVGLEGASVAGLILLRELSWRDEEDWRKAIVAWLGPQRMSIEHPRAEFVYARGAVMACAILRQLLGTEP